MSDPSGGAMFVSDPKKPGEQQCKGSLVWGRADMPGLCCLATMEEGAGGAQNRQVHNTQAVLTKYHHLRSDTLL